MDYFTDVLATFLDVDCDIYIAVNGREAHGMHKKYLNLPQLIQIHGRNLLGRI